MRLQATHFIEVWKGGCAVINSRVYDIRCLPYDLAATKGLGFETIAVFKIKMK